MASEYPAGRQSHHAHKLTRVLFKSCAAQDIGHHALALVIHVAHTEDAARYQTAVRFWNSQLMDTLGFKSPKQLNNARKAAMDAGWLVYVRGNDRSVGRYWTLIPKSVEKFDDEPIEPMRSDNGKHSPGGKHLFSESGTHSGMHCGTRCGKPSNPVPEPEPSNAANKSPDSTNSTYRTKTTSGRHGYPEDFELFWNAYPANDKGRRRGKQTSYNLWRQVPSADRVQLLTAAKNYAAETTEFIRDPERFLKANWWRDWIETATATRTPAAQRFKPEDSL